MQRLRQRKLQVSCLGLIAVFGIVAMTRPGLAAEPPWFEKQSAWNGFDRFHFHVADRAAYLVAPKVAAEGKPWVWRARFPDYHAEMDIMLLQRGFHIAYVDVAGMFGGPRAMRVADAFYTYVTEQRGLAAKPGLEGVSRGGLFVYNWAVRHPDRVACIYCDTPVCDFKSWPGGSGGGIGSPSDWKKCLNEYGLTPQQAKSFEGNPVDQAKIIAQQRIPILHIVSQNDEVVPPAENSILLKSRLEQCGWQMELISVSQGTEQSHGHHFEHPAPSAWWISLFNIPRHDGNLFQFPAVGAKGGSWQSCLIAQIAAWVRFPPVANGHRLGYVGACDDDGCPINGGFCRYELLVRTGNLKPLQFLAVR